MHLARSSLSKPRLSWLVVPLVAALAPSALAQKKPPALPPTQVRLWLAAPTAEGLWTMRIDNPSEHPARVPADVRALHIEVDASDGHGKRTFKCDLPSGLGLADFPERRALLLGEGESYVESFDPHLFCFGKNVEALRGGNTVRATLGWPSKSRGSQSPWAVESTEDPLPFANAKTLDAPTIVLPFDHEPGASWTEDAWMAPNAPAPPTPPPLPTAAPEREHTLDHYTSGREARIAAAAQNRRRWDRPVNVITHQEPPRPKPKVEDEVSSRIVDENAPRFDITIDNYIDASTRTRIPMGIKATNVGKRPMMVVIRPRMLSLTLDGPDGIKRCDADSSTGAVARDSFRSVTPGETISMNFLLGEICPLEVFSRPGLYHMQATLTANEQGLEIGLTAYTGESTSNDAWLRLQTAPDPFYSTVPRSIPTETLHEGQ